MGPIIDRIHRQLQFMLKLTDQTRIAWHKDLQEDSFKYIKLESILKDLQLNEQELNKLRGEIDGDD